MTAQATRPLSTSATELRADLDRARDAGVIATAGALRLRLAASERNCWIVCALHGRDVAGLRIGVNAGPIANVEHTTLPDGTVAVDFTTPLGPMRALIRTCGDATFRCTASLMPIAEVAVLPMPRDLVLRDPEGDVLTHQRGLRSGIVYAAKRGDDPFSVFYFQNFSALNPYFEQTGRTPADSVGGRWPELGFALPAGETCTLPCAREFVLSDAFVTFADDAPEDTRASAALYLDLFAQTYLALDPPPVEYHDWPELADHALRALATSPACADVRQGRHYMLPYVADATKPPESMVQFTLAMNIAEYDGWRGEASRIERRLRSSASRFFDENVGSLVRWLPGEPFDEHQREDNMSHEAMDSWYIHHAVFNAWRFAREGDTEAKQLFARSLAFLVRVAHRFDYHWPVFFNLRTLDIVRAEADKGRGGERDVAGLYALLMVHAYEMFGDEAYLREAETAACCLAEFGFDLAYQMNTTGFAAEAAMRLWTITGKRGYVGVAELCLANLFDNMWLWRCTYGTGAKGATYFGLFPLRDAPYLAAYEELEVHAKFHEFLALAGDAARPSLRLLIAEFQKYSLHRSWYYYPSSLPADSVAEHPRNGRIERGLAIPLEDLRDGRERSGQVGQEVYGAGLAFVMTTRHYVRFAAGRGTLYSDYPMYDFTEHDDGRLTWRAGGDPRGCAQVRVFFSAAEPERHLVRAWTRAGDVRVPLRGELSAEGHALFTIRGAHVIEIACARSDATPEKDEIAIGSPAYEAD